mmetsp:Transcript_10873/g.21504  ORF Transcript_10873/g.21504 Transcript_10873/m.21504 type:complete len:121 (+) Transcript_10873:191-553(+)|eukprot:CAMPEP_0173414928 /NCGR_PEP_ID=MMETSP1356-20130122/84588_1 /TAXON_ID=77927 ORGANISM="Hemiselmis virescens, Strain PCC157" /NCGR_SAMPLE_ID=MMETSP1356 /ASSEMBLY_ACC=CAM_ASM_000847 /LENGTH=120 /DNA_ID=CAMNT_0014377139 /DNA_START=191 /DNA_END=553 /DNA_ORIENTATION=+
MAAPSPDPSKLVERLQALKKRLSNMAKTLETNVASASPVRGIQSDDIVYTTPRLVKELIDGKLGEDRSLFVDRVDGDEGASGEYMEVRFTLSAASDEEMEDLINMLRANPEVQPTALNLG